MGMVHGTEVVGHRICNDCSTTQLQHQPGAIFSLQPSNRMRYSLDVHQVFVTLLAFVGSLEHGMIANLFHGE